MFSTGRVELAEENVRQSQTKFFQLHMKVTMQTYQKYITFDTFDRLEISQNKKQRLDMKATYLTYARKSLFSKFQFWIKHLLKICKEVQVSRKEI